MTFHIIHRWVSLSSQQGEYIHFDRKGTPVQQRGDGSPITEVLQRCSEPRCAEVRTITLDGHWTFEQVTKDVTRRI